MAAAYDRRKPPATPKPAAPSAADISARTFEREVAEEIRAEQLKKLWADYGTYLVAAVVAVLLGIVIYQQVHASRIASAEAVGVKYSAALDLVTQNKPAEAVQAFGDIAKSGSSGYAAIARLQQGGLAARDGKTAEAVAAYDAVASDTAVDGILRDMARLQAAALRLPDADWTEAQNRLTPLVDERNAFRSNARELLGLAALKAGKKDDARKLFIQVLGDGKSSKALKDRVSSYMAGIVAGDLAKAVGEVPKAAGEPGKADAPKADAPVGDATKK